MRPLAFSANGELKTAVCFVTHAVQVSIIVACLSGKRLFVLSPAARRAYARMSSDCQHRSCILYIKVKFIFLTNVERLIT